MNGLKSRYKLAPGFAFPSSSPTPPLFSIFMLSKLGAGFLNFQEEIWGLKLPMKRNRIPCTPVHFSVKEGSLGDLEYQEIGPFEVQFSVKEAVGLHKTMLEVGVTIGTPPHLNVGGFLGR